MRTFHIDDQFHGYSVQYSPFQSNEIACAAAQNFGLNGRGCLFILEKKNDGLLLRRRLFYNNGLYDLAWNEFSQSIIVTGSNDGCIQIWNWQSEMGLETSFKAHECEISSVAWSLTRDRPLYATGSWDKTIKVWDPVRDQPLRTVNGHGGLIYSIAWSPYIPGVILSASGDGDARVWDTRSGQLTNLLHAGSGELLSCDWTKYESTICVTSGTDSSLRVWDLRNSNIPIQVLNGHNYPARRIKCSPHDQHIIASASYDKTIRIWNYLLSSKPIETIKHHSEFVSCIDFNLKNQEEIVDCSWDRTVKVYHPQSLKTNSLETHG